MPRELGWSHHDSFWESDSSDTVANSLVSEWAAIPQEMRREATLTLPLGVDDNEKVAFGQWQYTLMGMKRSFLVTLNGELLTRQRVEDFIVNLHPEAVRGQFGWLAELPS